MNKKILLPLLAGMTIIGSTCVLAVAEDATPVGTYTSFALGNEGYVVSTALSDVNSNLIMTLNEDGTCIVDYGEGDTDEISWENEDSNITFDMDGEVVKGTCKDGIIEFSPLPGSSIFLAKEGVDLSNYDMIKTEEELAKMREEIAAKREANIKEIFEKYDLKNDDTHTLYKQADNYFCKELDKDGNLLSFTCYNFSLTEDSIPEFKEMYESSGSFDRVEQDGACLIIDFPTDIYTLEMIDRLYGDYVYETK